MDWNPEHLGYSAQHSQERSQDKWARRGHDAMEGSRGDDLTEDSDHDVERREQNTVMKFMRLLNDRVGIKKSL